MTTPPHAAEAPRLGLGALGIIVRVLVAIGTLVIGNLVAGLLPALVSLIPGAVEVFGGTSPWGFALALVIQAAVLLVVVLAVRLWARWFERAPIRAVGWRWAGRDALALLLGVTVAALTLLAVRVLVPATGAVPEGASALGDQSGAPVPLLIVYFLGLAFLQQSIPEELLFRGWLLWSLRGRPVLAVTVVTLSFTAIHLVSNGGQQSPVEHVLYLALPLGFSLLATGLLLWTRSLWAAIGVHGGFHVGNYLATAAFPQVDAVLSWVAIGGVQAALGAVLVVVALARGRGIPDGRD
ncbi:CPBP family intramembrane glutamic endopeptidase [Schumannella luteola]|jgi:membrane protease YdiL (CAAX protease family)